MAVQGGATDWDDGALYLASVGSYRANPFGLHDVLGNVTQRCKQLPEEAAIPVGTLGDLRYARGGNRRSHPDAGRSAFRGFFDVPACAQPSLGLEPARELTARGGVG